MEPAVCRQILLDAISSRKTYTEEDKDYLTNIICKDISNLPLLAQFIVLLTPTTYCGRFSQIFNYNLHYYIVKRLQDNILELYNNGLFNNFVEFTDNKYLTEMERNDIFNIVDREYSTVLTLLKSNEDIIFGNETCPMPPIVNEGKNASLYSECLDDVCIKTGISISEEEKDTFTIAESGEMYCLPVLTLLDKYIKGELVITEETKSLIEKSLSKEIKLYRSSVEYGI